MICIKCNRKNPKCGFGYTTYRNRRKMYRYQYKKCRDCHNEDHREWTKNNKNRIKKHNSNYYETHRTYFRDYYLKRKDG